MYLSKANLQKVCICDIVATVAGIDASKCHDDPAAEMVKKMSKLGKLEKFLNRHNDFVL